MYTVLVNNAGILRGMGMAEDAPATTVRAIYDELLNTHITSVAVVTQAFLPLLRRAAAPKVINVTSGLGSMTNVLTPGRRMGRSPPYGASKIGMNGLTVHMQVGETDRAASGSSTEPRVRFFIANPGILSTAFNGFHPLGKPPQHGAESIVALIGDDEAKYDTHMYWEFEDGQMRQVPW